MVQVLNWGIRNWEYLWLLWFLGVFKAVRDFILSVLASIAHACEALTDRGGARKIMLERAREKTALAEANLVNARTAAAQFDQGRERMTVSTDSPHSGGPCHHLQLASVRERGTDRLLRWICANELCGREFPPEYARFEEEEET
jgi:hypothetical protein